MHVGDGQLAPAVLAVGAAGGMIGLAGSLRHLHDRDIPRVAVLASLFFAASLWHVPVPLTGTSIHLVLCGLLGLLLGWHTFLAVTLVLIFQALMFGHGGITSLGVNIVAMALPGPIIAAALRPVLNGQRFSAVFVGGFLLGAGSILLACMIVATAYAASSTDFLGYLPVYFAANLPLMLIEGMLTGSTVTFLARVRPDIIGRPLPLIQERRVHVS